LKKTSNLIRARLPESSRPLNSELQPVVARNPPRQPIHPAAYLRQSKGRWYTTHSTVVAALRRFSSSAAGPKYNRSSFPKSAIGSAVTRLPTQAPFATTLRPNLTGGALPRSAGGYGLGGGRAGARYFSHTPASPAQVVNNVSAAVRAFWLSGQRVQYDGMNPHTGEKRYRTVSVLQEQAGRTMRLLPRATPGSFVDFQLSPVVTALSPLSKGDLSATPAERTESLNTEGLLDILSIDFSRALRDLSAVLTDLKRLGQLGDLPITLLDKSTLRVHFPGCDALTVENLCDEVGVQRGIVHQGPDFDAFVGTEMALLFPFASSGTASFVSETEKSARSAKRQCQDGVNWESMISPSLTSLGFSNRSVDSLDSAYEEVEANPWLSSPSGYSSISKSGSGGEEPTYFEPTRQTLPGSAGVDTGSQFEGLEGIYRFLEECDTARR
jgi:hypothetical protein